MSAILKQHGHNTKVQIFNLRNPKKKDIDRIIEYRPDIIGLPIYTGWHKSVIEFCKIIKKTINVATIVGGPHATYFPYIVKNDGIDYLCAGEGEIAFINFINALAKHERIDNIPGIWLKQNGTIIENGFSELPDLLKLPHMDIDLYRESYKEISNMKHREFSFNRGCMFKCAYCVNRTLNSIYKGKALRSKSPNQAIDEIQYVYDKTPFSSVTFVNDTLFWNKSDIKNFLDLYKTHIKMPFFCNLRLEMIDDETVKMLKDANCSFVSVGVESGSPRIRNKILNRQMTNQQIINGITTLKQFGIGVNTNCMVGIPGETFDEAIETIELVQKTNPTTVWCSIFQPYPGTVLTKKMIEQKEITSDIFDEIPASFFDRSVIKAKGIHKFVNLQRFFYFSVKYPILLPIIKLLCNLKVGRAYDIFFILAFYKYLRKSHKESFLSALGIIYRNSIAALFS